LRSYLARFKGQSRIHTESDLRSYLAWCESHGLDPRGLTAPCRAVRPLAPRGSSIPAIAGVSPNVGCRGVLPHLRNRRRTRALTRRVRPATQRPTRVPDPELTHLQFEALLCAAKDSTNRYDFALFTMLGLLGLRIFEATGSNIHDLGEEHGHRVLRVFGKGGKGVLVPLPPAVRRAIERAVDIRQDGPILLTRRGTRMDRHCATRRLRRLAESTGLRLPRMHPHMLRHTFVTSCSTQVWTCATCR
jgi:integrase/recombinase XerD